MPKLSAADRAQFAAYVRSAEQSAGDLAFLLDNLGERVELDYSVDSLANAEAVYWRNLSQGIPADLCNLDDFAQLLGRYLGQCLIRQTGAKWVQCEDQNPLFAQPCVDGFGGQEWDRIYPIHAAQHLGTLPEEKPNFPGVREHRVFATKLEKALAICATSRALG
jgi:hypothetical protein